jgi:hypothetical protein
MKTSFLISIIFVMYVLTQIQTEPEVLHVFDRANYGFDKVTA